MTLANHNLHRTASNLHNIHPRFINRDAIGISLIDKSARQAIYRHLLNLAQYNFVAIYYKAIITLCADYACSAITDISKLFPAIRSLVRIYCAYGHYHRN